MGVQLFNLNFYKFLQLESREVLREELRALCAELDLRGTILLAPEGVNVAVSGTREALDRFRAFAIERWEIPLSVMKEAEVPEHSFKRMLVKLRKEIIPVGESVDPARETAPRVSAQELKKWLDEGRDIVLLDTRNEYEIEVGTFRGAQSLKLEHSRQFAARAKEMSETDRKKEIVTFCTGGIRCEKGSAVMLKLGFEKVYQLDGGILRYLEENGSAHYDGNCFVFDWRLAVDGKLAPAPRSSQADAQFGRHLKAQDGREEV